LVSEASGVVVESAVLPVREVVPVRGAVAIACGAIVLWRSMRNGTAAGLAVVVPGTDASVASRN
jgi:hypothetical protein